MQIKFPAEGTRLEFNGADVRYLDRASRLYDSALRNGYKGSPADLVNDIQKGDGKILITAQTLFTEPTNGQSATGTPSGETVSDVSSPGTRPNS